MKELVAFNKEYYAVMSNDVVKGKQNSNLQEARFIRLMISQITQQDTELKTFTCRVQDFAKFFGIDSSNMYREVDKLCTNLLKSQVQVGSGNPKRPWKKINWFGSAEYDGDGNLTLRLNKDIRPHVLRLNKWYTQYQLKNIIDMKSTYGIRLYEILKCDNNKAKETRKAFTFEVKELKEMLGCEKEYKQIGQFKEKVIDKALKEICENTDLEVSVEYIKTGRSITHVCFYVALNSKNMEQTSIVLF